MSQVSVSLHKRVASVYQMQKEAVNVYSMRCNASGIKWY